MAAGLESEPAEDTVRTVHRSNGAIAMTRHADRGTGATEMLARFVTETSHSTLPAEVIAAAKVGILDGIANMVAAATQPLAGIVVDYLTQLGGNAHGARHRYGGRA